MEPVLIGIPSYRGAENGAEDLLGWCLKAIRLRTGNGVPYEIVVVDDSGRPEHWMKSKAVCDTFGARWLKHETNLGISAAWNTLVRSGTNRFVAILNDDLIVSRHWLEAGTYVLRENTHVGSVGFFAHFSRLEDLPVLLSGPDTAIPPRSPFGDKPFLPEDKWGEHHGREQPGIAMAPTGCGFMLRREVYDEVGGFPVQVKSFYEETWFGTACAEKGYASYCLQWPTVYHLWSATFGRWSEELRPDVAASRAKYVAHWGQHYDRPDGTHRRFMSRISQLRPLRWLDPNGPREETVVGERPIPYAVNLGPPELQTYGDGSKVQCGIPVVVDVIAEDGTRHRVTLALRVEDVQQLGASASDYKFEVKYVVEQTQVRHPDERSLT